MIKKSEIWRRRVDLRQDHESIANAQTAATNKKKVASITFWVETEPYVHYVRGFG
jgi:hypothetical protein